MSEVVLRGKLVNAQQLLDELFAPECRPSMRWLRSQTRAKSLPHVKMGHLVFFDVELVRTALGNRNLFRGRVCRATATKAA